MLTSTPSWPLVGRAPDLSRVVDALAEPSGVGVVIAGTGGVGKSRLAHEVLDRKVAAGEAVARTLATRSSSTVPLGALIPIFPTSHDRAPTLQTARRALTELAESGSLVLFVDDAHLLDDLSAAVVLSVASDPRINVLATIRTGEPAPDAITALWKDAGAFRLDLDPLDRSTVARLLADVLGGPVDDLGLDRLMRLCGGRPFALQQIVQAASRSGQIRRNGSGWIVDADLAVPTPIAELIDDSLERVGGRAVELVATLALTEPLPVAVIDRLGLRSELEVLEDRGLVRVTEQSTASPVVPVTDQVSSPCLIARLDQGLYGDVALARTGALRRRSLLTACSRALLAADPSEADRFRALLWRFEAGESIDPDVLVQGARWAYGAGDHRCTRDLAEAAWKMRRNFAAGHLFGFALSRTNRGAEAEAVLAAATELACDDQERVLAALARTENLQRGLGDVAAALRCCIDAEATVEAPSWRAELRAHRAMMLTQTGAIDGALTLVAPLLDEANRAPRAYVKAAYAAGIALVHAGRPQRATALALDALPLHEAIWRRELFQTEPGVHHLTSLFAMLGQGDLGEAASLLTVARDLTRPALPRYAHAWVLLMSGIGDLLTGSAVDGQDHFVAAEPIFLQGNQREVARWCRAGAATCAALAGDVATADRHLEAVDELDVPGLRLNQAMIDEARGWRHAATGDREAARSTFTAGIGEAVALGDRFGAARLLHAKARLGAADDVSHRMDRLAADSESPLIDLMAFHVRSLTAGSPAALSRDVSEAAERHGALLWAAEAAAEAVRRTKQEGDQREAARFARRTDALIERCQGVRTHLTMLTAGPEVLTARERDVARLAADRLSSKEIAAHLHLSSRTVDNHLRRIYRKLGVSGRRDLASALHLS